MEAREVKDSHSDQQSSCNVPSLPGSSCSFHHAMPAAEGTNEGLMQPLACHDHLQIRGSFMASSVSGAHWESSQGELEATPENILGWTSHFVSEWNLESAVM